MIGTFLQAAAILFREGLEAMLVVTALAVYLERAGARERIAALYLGAGFAVAASLATAWVFQRFYGGAHDDRIEAVVLFVAAALMLYVSGWLLLRQDAQAWQRYVRQKADRALAQRTVLAIGTLAFLAVFREGAETVLFVHALAKTGGGWSLALAAGLGTAALALVLAFVIIRGFSRRLPLRPVFLATSAFLFAMAVKLIGDAFQELQEQAIVSYHEVGAAGWLGAIGLNPTAEALAAQGAVVACALATFAVAQRRSRREALARADG